MAKVMLVYPWDYHDEGIQEHDLTHEWRNGPYSLLLLATQLKKFHHQVMIVDMTRDLVFSKGDVKTCLTRFSQTIQQFRPDIIGFSFFSIHYFEVEKAVETARQTCLNMKISPLFIAGGIHASIEPQKTLEKLGFDYVFIGEADVGIVQFADGQTSETITGVTNSETVIYRKGEEVNALDSLPFPDWSLCDYQFYAHPTFSRLKIKQSQSLDMMMGRGCVYKCRFCAYNTLSSVRFYSAEYLIEQIEYMRREFGINAVYFIDSTIGNNRKLLQEFCELMIRRKLSEHMEWYGNIRPNQVNEELLKFMWLAGCRYLFYGFESGSQRVLNFMNKGLDVRKNYKIAELHNKLRFPYNASIILGYPGEREVDILQTFEFLKTTQPPSIGINWYVPLPGSPDYNHLKAERVITIDDPYEWRRIGEVNTCRVYADVPEKRFRELFAQAEHLAYVDIPKALSKGGIETGTSPQKYLHSKIRSTVQALLRSLHAYKK